MLYRAFVGVLWVFCCGYVLVGIFFLVSLVFFVLSVFASFCILPAFSGALSSFIKFLTYQK
jgi:hypothetical protein